MRPRPFLFLCLFLSPFVVGAEPTSRPSGAALEKSGPALTDDNKPVVSDLKKLTSWRGRWYNATGTSLLVASPGSDWSELASLPDRVAALAGSTHALAAAGRGFVWLKPRGRNATPLLLPVPGDWIALHAHEEAWVAVSATGELLEFDATGSTTVHRGGGVGRIADFIRAWDQWWLVGQKAGEALILTATSLEGPWSDASPGGKSPLVRVASVGGSLLVFAADGRVYRAVEGEAWQPVSANYQAGPQPPLHLAANEVEGLVTLSADALRQTLDGLHWNVLPYPIDEYNSQALVATDYGLAMATLPSRLQEKPVVLEPATPHAAFRLAQAYAAGDGVPVEPEHAITLFRQAAEAGIRRAKVELAFLIASEQVKGADLTEASSLFLELCGEPAERVAPTEARARITAKALRHHGPSQGVLAVIHRLGFGGKADPIEASAWTMIAEDHQANLYDLAWYHDEDDDLRKIEARVRELRASLQR